VAQVLARAFGSTDALAGATAERIDDVPEIGPEIAGSVRTFFSEPRNRDLIRRLQRLGVEPQAAARRKGGEGGPLRAKTFVFTGALSSMTREEAGDAVERMGGHVGSSVSRKTDYVVVGEDPGSKAARAEKLGIQMLDEEAFLKLVGRPPGQA
jgi:DNA ligase (NAD+)